MVNLRGQSASNSILKNITERQSEKEKERHREINNDG